MSSRHISVLSAVLNRGGSIPLSNAANTGATKALRYSNLPPPPGENSDSGRPSFKPPQNTTKPTAEKQDESPTYHPSAEPKPGTGTDTIAHQVSKYLHLPNLPTLNNLHAIHRPTKEELLSAANGFWQRLKVRFKWASIRSMRPWNADEWGAFVSWFMLGHIVWILVGTTTFFSIIIWAINTVVAQETLAQWIGDYLTQSAGVTIVFESAIVPKWKDGVISFRNVFVSRRPGQILSSVSKGSSTDAAAVAAAERQPVDSGSTVPITVDDGNYTQYDVTMSTVNVTLSFLKWWNGKGLLKDVEIKGVRGIIDRTSVFWPENLGNPLDYRYEHQPGDFELDSFKMEDFLVTVHHPDGFRPFPVSIYSCELPKLRKHWLYYDFLSANHMSGSFDGSLFTIHPRQVQTYGPAATLGTMGVHMESIGPPEAWKKVSRMRIDGLKIDHLNRGVAGPFGWIYEGNVDIVADIIFPNDEDEGLSKVVSDVYDHLEEIVISNRARFLKEAPEYLDRTGLSAVYKPAFSIHAVPSDAETEAEPETHVSAVPSSYTLPSQTPVFFDDHYHNDHPPPSRVSLANQDDRRYVLFDLRINLNDVKATMPLFTNDMSYVNQALVRPIVAYINAKRTRIPISCRLVKRHSDFRGSLSAWDCGLMDDLSAETYDAFARDVEDQHNRVRRLRKVGFWTLSMAIQALFMGMAGSVM
ncbi:Mitochondrial distribution and morphology protein 31 [Ceratocystis fimbriata CBS 114723]|uniref:Mitochondrial distribution and morphology protein 31 n=1 Tax=Ceratocystis fimbriata CBS 114723 TaxID=1035309 RepID=A0A2C5XG18_9PEZI|nr:Mitochondrial distribution and morphology protein 31 [Ceratocystis fimbriata CBS 114723]